MLFKALAVIQERDRRGAEPADEDDPAEADDRVDDADEEAGHHGFVKNGQFAGDVCWIVVHIINFYSFSRSCGRGPASDGYALANQRSGPSAAGGCRSEGWNGR